MPEKKTEDAPDNNAPEVDEKQYNTFKAMFDKYIIDKKAEEDAVPARTKAAEEQPKFNILSSLFGGQ